jgi:hypothetical protein
VRGGGELRHEVGGRTIGPGDELREEGHEEREVEERGRGSARPQVHVERVRHRLERVERDAHRSTMLESGGR